MQIRDIIKEVKVNVTEAVLEKLNIFLQPDWAQNLFRTEFYYEIKITRFITGHTKPHM